MREGHAVYASSAAYMDSDIHGSFPSVEGKIKARTLTPVFSCGFTATSLEKTLNRRTYRGSGSGFTIPADVPYASYVANHLRLGVS